MVPYALSAPVTVTWAPEALRQALVQHLPRTANGNFVREFIQVGVLPFTSAEGMYERFPTGEFPLLARQVLLSDSATPPAPFPSSLSTPLSFGNPYPASWQLYGELLAQAPAGNGTMVSVRSVDFLDSLKMQPRALRLAPVQQLLVDGKDALTATTVRTSPTFRWTPSLTGTPNGYILEVGDGKDAPSTARFSFYTYRNSVSIPPGVLVPGDTYTFHLRAVMEPNTDFRSAPLHQSLPVDEAEVITAPLLAQ